MKVARVSVALVLALAACGDLNADRPGGALSAPSRSASTGSPAPNADCVTLGAVGPRPAPLLDITDLGDGAKRATSTEAGYSIVVPSAWLTSGSFSGALAPMFGQFHATSFDPRTAPTPKPEAGNILLPEVGIHLDIELWSNPLRQPLDRYAQDVRIGPDQIGVLPGSAATLAGRGAYRFTIQDERRFQPASGQVIATRQTRSVWLVPTTRDDRLLVIAATPAESALLATVERALATLKVTAPVTPVYGVTVQRSEVLKQWRIGTDGGPIPGRRAEAKLMTYTEANAALMAPTSSDPNAPHALGLPRIDHDPDDLFWVVSVSGPGLPEGRSGPPGPGSSPRTAPPTTWMLYDISATGDRNVSTGGQYATQGTWSPVFDALSDRCR